MLAPRTAARLVGGGALGLGHAGGGDHRGQKRAGAQEGGGSGHAALSLISAASSGGFRGQTAPRSAFRRRGGHEGVIGPKGSPLLRLVLPARSGPSGRGSLSIEHNPIRSISMSVNEHDRDLILAL